MARALNVVVVGVGAVGVEMLRVLRQRRFPAAGLTVLARSARRIEVDGVSYEVRTAEPGAFEGARLALFAGTEGEKGAAVTLAGEAVSRGAVVIDNGADFRMDPKVPLVVPEVNPDDAARHEGIIANPNCSTIQMVVALWPIHRRSRIRRIILSSYQSVSGTGRAAMEELREQSPLVLDGRADEARCAAYPHRIAFNVIPQIGSFGEMGYTTEEWKTRLETHKIFHDDSIQIASTTVRVPVFNGHSESVYIETEEPLAVEEVRRLLAAAPGVVLVDDPAEGRYPMPVEAAGRDETFVGRIRRDPDVERGLHLWVVADNLRKGAATNAVQIAELLLGRRMF
ncbi:MAG: aspartate-semialdehyde dehydrogenase [bacterium]|nr:aspartate-semialdehyde dehydrogenase [bacterium]